VAFVTYATQRVRGAVLDELRAADWRPRSVRERARRIESAARELHSLLERPPTPDEVARALDISSETYWQWRGDAEAGTTVSLETPVGGGSEREGASLAERLPDTEGDAPDAQLE